MSQSDVGKNNTSVSSLVRWVLAIWFTLVFVLSAAELFVSPPGTPPLRVLSGVFVPLVVFLGAFWFSKGFRKFVLTIDLPLAAGIQAWRAAGLAFLALYTYSLLPGIFAWPAGLGDIAIGVTAPWVITALVRDRSFITTQRFVVWNLLGILDLVIAVGLGALSAGLGLGVANGATTTPMARLPLVLIPAYLVPVFIMLHLAALFQARRALVLKYSKERSKRTGAPREPSRLTLAH
jgi:hypothetical protein